MGISGNSGRWTFQPAIAAKVKMGGGLRPPSQWAYGPRVPVASDRVLAAPIAIHRLRRRAGETS